MEKWFLLVEDLEEGPFSFEQLAKHPDLNANSLVRLEGESHWSKAKDREELKELFKKQEPKSPQVEMDDTQIGTGGEIVLSLNKDPSQFFLWLLLILIVIVTFFWNRGY